ncbi:MAG: DUF3313 family protein [Pseudomonadota bacterium]
MKSKILIAFIVISCSACHFIKPHEKVVQAQAEQAGLSPDTKTHFDVTFISSAVDFSQYKKLKADNLDLTQVKIINPSAQNTFQEPWQLNDDDRAYYQAKYLVAVQKSLFNSGLYISTTEAGADTLVLKARITQIAPHASKDDLNGRPNFMKVYSEGFGRMTVVFEIQDSVSGKLVAMAADEHDLGSIWEENNRAQNNMQIRLAFDFWLNNLRKELTEAAKK